MDDDFEIEITNLDTGATSHHALSPKEPGEPEYNNDDDSSEPQPPASKRRRGLRAAIVTSIVLLAVVIVVATNSTAHSSLYTVFGFPTPVPSPTPLPGGDILYLEHGAPWGVVTLDGKKSEFAHLGTTISWIKIPRGRHTIAVTQAPFPPLRCVISYPAATNDSCPLFSPLDNQGQPLGAQGHGIEIGSDPNFAGGVRFIDLGARFSMLPQDAQDALVVAVGAELAPPSIPVTLQPGDHYLRDDGTVAVAHTTLQATFIPTLLSPANSIASDSQSCVSFCDISGVGLGGGGTWDIMVSMLGSWRITTADGQVIAQHAPMFVSDPLYQDMAPSTQAVMGILWTGKWQVSTRNRYGYDFSSVCQMAQNMVGLYINNSQLSILGMNAQPGRTPEQGCALSIPLNDTNTSNPPYILYRFGVLLAANDAAHRAFPSLPVASPAERAATQQILGQLNNP